MYAARKRNTGIAIPSLPSNIASTLIRWNTHTIGTVLFANRFKARIHRISFTRISRLLPPTLTYNFSSRGANVALGSLKRTNSTKKDWKYIINPIHNAGDDHQHQLILLLDAGTPFLEKNIYYYVQNLKLGPPALQSFTLPLDQAANSKKKCLKMCNDPALRSMGVWKVSI